MAGNIVVRFHEFEYYDINHDEDWVRFTATMDKGSYFAEVPRGTFKDFRENRDKFKAKVIDYLASQVDPCEIRLEDTVH
jgi:hypothetical protein